MILGRRILGQAMPNPYPPSPSQGDIVSPWFTWYATSLPRSAVVGLGTARREIPPSCPDSPVAKSVYAGQDVRDDALPQPSSRTLCRLTRTWPPAHLAKRRDLSACGRVAPELRLAPSSCDTAIPYETLHFLRVSCWIAARHVRRIKKTPRSNVPLRVPLPSPLFPSSPLSIIRAYCHDTRCT